jgi:L-threonylcarbamoyladenylate synthase
MPSMDSPPTCRLDARKLAEAFWPGGLTLILHSQPSLDWDLGETKGTVALRMPADDIALELLTLTGPLAVSSANRTGQAAGQTAAAAREQLAESVEVYLEGGFRPQEGEAAVPSTIVDATGPLLRVVRNGAVSLEQLREQVPGVLGLGEIPMAAEEPEASDTPEAPEASDTPEAPEAEAHTEAPKAEAHTEAEAHTTEAPKAEADTPAGSSAASTTDNHAGN